MRALAMVSAALGVSVALFYKRLKARRAALLALLALLLYYASLPAP